MNETTYGKCAACGKPVEHNAEGYRIHHCSPYAERGRMTAQRIAMDKELRFAYEPPRRTESQRLYEGLLLLGRQND